MHSVSRQIRIGAVVEGRRRPGHYRLSNELQLQVNQLARPTTGCFHTTNVCSVSMEAVQRGF